MGAILLAGCDLMGKSGDDPQADTHGVRILTSDGTIIHSETLVDPPLVDLPEVSSSLEAAFEANWLTYEGRDQAPYDHRGSLGTTRCVPRRRLTASAAREGRSPRSSGAVFTSSGSRT